MYEADSNPLNLRHCTVVACRGLFYARGLCRKHYQRQHRGEPLGGKPGPPVTKRRQVSYVRGGRGV